MKQDYLWDKIGDDAEIKGLEEVLSAFRYQEIAAPIIRVAEPIPIVRPEPRWKFSFAFAFAGSAVLAVILIGVWLQFLNGQRQTTPIVTATSAPQPATPSSDPERYSNTSEISVDTIDNHAVTDVRAKGVFRQRVRKQTMPNLVATKVSSRKMRQIILTNEEKYAYGQLMLALSITGSKLKMVRDTINGED